MGNILLKPYTEEERLDFIVLNNHQNKLNITETDVAIFALKTSEIIQNNSIVDISETEEYQEKILKEKNTIKKANLQAQIDAFDLKRVRALAEGGAKDEITGQTWLEYYTEQIIALRNEISNLAS